MPRITYLRPDEESQYREWMKKIGHTPEAGFAVDPMNWDGLNYDYRGFFKKNGAVQVGEGEHLTDEFKLPSHPTFSVESIYAIGPDKALAGAWGGPDGETYTPSAARAMKDKLLAELDRLKKRP